MKTEIEPPRTDLCIKQATSNKKVKQAGYRGIRFS